ncbi:glycolipid transfer protein [Gloeophyllum trabeum ATCC 11539]|uniref:Glycolipid transfer protein n=1 Tax=Gloeophyllum trabeum (strain ATCC 11539 / FP-39264 / Madison 617) TaxID=670483 RepID=S7Q997_GLOTA|nr:glycolipid transfer protein [Gloeophyllum trabeum ATCC 11539]EPQ56087.1 glycolipid transfer protein [Gloeophyllum trabeum ATCC 11539]
MSKPHFETVRSFADVPITHEGVETSAFVEASEGLITMFDLFGSAVFGFVQSDLKSNLQGVRDKFHSARDSSRTLELLVRAEVDEGHRHATACLVRFIRGLLFTHHALRNAQADRGAELHVCFQRAYDAVLRHQHNFLVRSVVSVAIRAVPRRRDFFARLAQGGDAEKLDAELARWLSGLDAIVTRIKTFLEEGGYGRV